MASFHSASQGGGVKGTTSAVWEPAESAMLSCTCMVDTKLHCWPKLQTGKQQSHPWVWGAPGWGDVAEKEEFADL